MLKLSVKKFSNFEVICSKSKMEKELADHVIGYVKCGERTHPVIEAEIAYDSALYKDVNIPHSVVTPLAITNETPEGVENSFWFLSNGVSIENDEIYYDYFILHSQKFIYPDRDSAKEIRPISFKNMGKYPDMCSVTFDKYNNPILSFVHKDILNAVATTEVLKTMLPILYFREERISLRKWNDENGDMFPVMRFIDDGMLKYYAVMYEHTDDFEGRYQVELQLIDSQEVYYYQKPDMDKKD